MKIKNYFFYGLIVISFLTYQCSKKTPTTTLLPLLSSNTNSDSNSQGYYFSDYGTDEDYISKYRKMIPLVDYFDYNKGIKDKNCKAAEGATTSSALSGDTLDNLYNEFKNEVPTTPINLQTAIQNILDTAKTASNNVPAVKNQNANVSSGFNANGGYIRQKYTDDGKEKIYCRFLSNGGGEYKQFVEKGLFAYPYYNAMLILKDIKDKSNDDPKNNYTDREKNWDKSFSLFGVPTDYSFERYEKGSEEKGLSLQGKYAIEKIKKKGKWKVTSSNLRNLANDIMQKGFIAGRKAIENKDDNALDEAIKIVSQKWEQIIVASVLYYIENANGELGAKTESNRVKFAHVLSEGWAIAYSFYFIASIDADTTFRTKVPSGRSETITEQKVDAIFEKLNNATAVTKNNTLNLNDNTQVLKFHLTNAANLQEARKKIVEIYTEFQNEYTF